MISAACHVWGVAAFCSGSSLQANRIVRREDYGICGLPASENGSGDCVVEGATLEQVLVAQTHPELKEGNIGQSAATTVFLAESLQIGSVAIERLPLRAGLGSGRQKTPP